MIRDLCLMSHARSRSPPSNPQKHADSLEWALDLQCRIDKPAHGGWDQSKSP